VAWGELSTAATVMPHTGSTERDDGTGAACRSAARRSCTISASTDSAISAAVRPPMSSPAGLCTRARCSSGTSSAASTEAPRIRLATSPT
jgi:hypothetical protein